MQSATGQAYSRSERLQASCSSQQRISAAVSVTSPASGGACRLAHLDSEGLDQASPPAHKVCTTQQGASGQGETMAVQAEACGARDRVGRRPASAGAAMPPRPVAAASVSPNGPDGTARPQPCSAGEQAGGSSSRAACRRPNRSSSFPEPAAAAGRALQRARCGQPPCPRPSAPPAHLHTRHRHYAAP